DQALEQISRSWESEASGSRLASLSVEKLPAVVVPSAGGSGSTFFTVASLAHAEIRTAVNAKEMSLIIFGRSKRCEFYDGSQACRQEQVPCLLRISATHS